MQKFGTDTCEALACIVDTRMAVGITVEADTVRGILPVRARGDTSRGLKEHAHVTGQTVDGRGCACETIRVAFLALRIQAIVAIRTCGKTRGAVEILAILA